MSASNYDSAETQHAFEQLLGQIHGVRWLPHTSQDFRGRLWLHAWRAQWESNLAQPDFAAEFGVYTQRLDTAMAGFIRTLVALTAEGETLTLLNVDLIPDHIRLWRGGARFIDWEQSSLVKEIYVSHSCI